MPGALRDIASLRTTAQSDLEEPPVYKPFRFVSIYLSWILLNTPITPNQLTLSWLVSLAMASYFMTLPTVSASIAAEIFLLLYYVLDCCDGEIARLRGGGSRLGSQLEQVSHWIGGGFLLLGASWSHLKGDPTSIAIGAYAAANIGMYTFYFVFYQLMLLMAKDHNYGILHRLAWLIYLIMPLEANVLLITIPLGTPWFGVVLLAVLFNLSWAVVFSLYFVQEKRRLTQLPGIAIPLGREDA